MKEEKQIEMDAVDIEQFRDLIDILGVRKSFEEGEYHCEVCGDTMTYDNAKFVFPKCDRTVGFVCKNAICVVEFTLSEELDKQKTTETEK